MVKFSHWNGNGASPILGRNPGNWFEICLAFLNLSPGMISALDYFPREPSTYHLGMVYTTPICGDFGDGFLLASPHYFDMIIDLHLFLSRYCLHRACWTWLDKNYNANQGSMCSVNVFEPTKYRKLMGFYWISQVIDIWMIFGWSSFIYTVYIYISIWMVVLVGKWQVMRIFIGHSSVSARLFGGRRPEWRGCGWLWMVVDDGTYRLLYSYMAKQGNTMCSSVSCAYTVM